MSFAEFNHVKISGISVVVPAQEINIYDEAQYYNNNIRQIDRMRKKVGFFKRKVVDQDTCATDLAVNAAENLFSDLNISKDSIDALIYVHQVMSYPGVVDAYEIHHRLCLSESCIATGVMQGCAGWVYGLYLCSNLLEAGIHKRVLLLNADIPSKNIDLADRNSAPLFGDAGSATLLDYSEEKVASFYNITTISDGFDKIICPSSTGNGARLRYDLNQNPDSEFNAPLTEKFISKAGYTTNLLHRHLDGDAVFEFTINRVPAQIKETLHKSFLDYADVAQLCLHQANKQIVQSIAMGLDFPLDRVNSEVFSTYGNNTMCSIPTVILDLYAKNKQFESKPYLCSGFGNGLVIATCVIDLEHCKCGEIKTFVKPEDFKTREQWIEEWKKKVGTAS